MKINWFTPLLPLKTPKPGYTAHLIEKLSPHAEISMWVNQPDWDRSLEKLVTIQHCDEYEWRQADINIYQVKNHRDYDWIWTLSKKYPGINVLHDKNLNRLFYNALGVVVHDEELFETIRGFNTTPVLKMNLLEPQEYATALLEFIPHVIDFKRVALRARLAQTIKPVLAGIEGGCAVKLAEELGVKMHSLFSLKDS